MRVAKYLLWVHKKNEIGKDSLGIKQNETLEEPYRTCR